MTLLGKPVPARVTAEWVHVPTGGIVRLNEGALIISNRHAEAAAHLTRVAMQVEPTEVVRSGGIRTATNAVGYSSPASLLKRSTPRASAFTMNRPDLALIIEDIAESLWVELQAENPVAAYRNLEAAETIHDDWRIGSTPWTSGVLNHAVPLPYHYDKNNVPGTTSAMLWSKHPLVQGGHLHLPDLGYVIGCQHATATYFVGHANLHGVMPITAPKGGPVRRWSLVFYVVGKFVGLPGRDESLLKAQARRSELDDDAIPRLRRRGYLNH
jgi:hypothetical protein